MGNMGSLLPDVQHALELARQGIPKVQVYPELRRHCCIIKGETQLVRVDNHIDQDS